MFVGAYSLCYDLCCFVALLDVIAFLIVRLGVGVLGWCVWDWVTFCFRCCGSLSGGHRVVFGCFMLGVIVFIFCEDLVLFQGCFGFDGSEFCIGFLGFGFCMGFCFSFVCGGEVVVFF